MKEHDPTLMLAERIGQMARMVANNPDRIGVLSTGEQIAVALVLDRVDLLRGSGRTILQLVARLGPEWTEAAKLAQDEGWYK